MKTPASRFAVPFLCLSLSALLLIGGCSNKHLVSIAITPADPSVSAIGQTIQFQAVGATNHPNAGQETLTNSVTWSSSNVSVATMSDSGLATAVSCGQTTVTAQDGNVMGQTTLTVACSAPGGNSVLQSITVYPSNPTIPLGNPPTPLTAFGVYSPPPSIDLTSAAVWASSNTGVVTVGSSGRGIPGSVSAVGCGTATISAEFQGIIGQTQLTVSCSTLQSISVYPPDPTVPLGQSPPAFTAFALWSPSGPNPDVTANANWSSSNEGVATVSNPGQVNLIGCGTTTISAQDKDNGVIGQTQLTVTCAPPVLQSISLYPPNATVAANQTVQFNALAVYSPSSSNNDLTKSATWNSLNGTVASITSPGVISTHACGTTTISAAYQGTVGQTQLTVSCTPPSLQSITILPGNPTIPQIGQTTGFVAVETSSDGTEKTSDTVAWLSSNTYVASIDSTGKATAVSCGTTTISAEDQNVVGTTLLTVSCTPINSVELLIVQTGSNPASIVSSPSGINCGTTCASEFNEGTGITLTATAPALWSGCDFPPPPVRANVCILTVRPDTAGGSLKTVTATY
ncbi:MAG: Ig-like domain-containing protein [Acidobacteriia bacterium]|nr:Ig-like domain-containing protein [Terriglobia bacterium]